MLLLQQNLQPYNVSATQAGSWSLANFATGSQAGSWSVAGVMFASGTQPGAWSVANFATGTQAGRWSVANFATGSVSGAWSVANYASAAQAGSWSIVSYANATQASAWSVAGFAIGGQPGAWSISAYVEGTQAGAWSVGVSVAVESGGGGVSSKGSKGTSGASFKAIAPYALRGESPRKPAKARESISQTKAEKNDKQLQALAEFGKQLAVMVSEGQAQAEAVAREIADYQDAQIIQINEDDDMMALAAFMLMD